MTREISRAEFLSMAVLAVGSLFGLGTIIKLLTGKSITSKNVESGISSNDYGHKH
jgi:hypothetical protein